jgi:hypothetical protein
MYRFTIFDDKLEVVQTLLADYATVEGTVIAFTTDEKVDMIYNLPAGYSILKEDV